MNLPSPLHSAQADIRLRPCDLSVFVVLWSELDGLQYRPVKHRWLARQARLHRVTLVRSLARLCLTGYIERGPVVGGLRTYRKLETRATAQAKDRPSGALRAP